VKKAVFLILLVLIPCSLAAMLMETFEQPIEGLSSNAVIDIVTHKNGIWLATGRGVSFTPDSGATWFYFDSTNGLVSDEISAIYSDDTGGRLWLATNHTATKNGITYPNADGLSFTDNEGELWDTLMVKGSYGPQATVFDITGNDTLIFGASWAGGLFGSFDRGVAWQSFYASIQDSLTPLDYTNLYFSAAIDTMHHDSLVLWGGTADGLVQYIFGPAYAKPSSNYIFSISAVDSFVYIAGDSGLTQRMVRDGKESFFSSFQTNGLPGRAVTAVFSFGGRLFAGTLDSLGGVGTGLAVSDDNGISFQPVTAGLTGLIGSNKYPLEFASVGQNLFMAAFEAGLYMTPDTGHVWQKVYVDSLDTTLANGRNIIHSVAADSSNLWVGTDSGLVKLFLDNLGVVDSFRYFSFTDSDTTGARSFRVAVQDYRDSAGVYDSSAIWSVNHPLNPAVGHYSVHRLSVTDNLWDIFPADTPYYDIDFIESAVYLVGKNRFSYSPNGKGFVSYPASTISDYFNPTLSLDKQDLNCIDIFRDTIYIGSSKGMAISPAGANIWFLTFANHNPKHQDRANRYTISTIYPISGNWVTALGVQPLPDGTGKIWATTRPGASGGGYDGISVASLDGQGWEVRDSGAICWNYAFLDSQVFAATTAGLLHSRNLGQSWDTIKISGVLANFNPPIPYSISQGTPAYAVRIIGNYLWTGTDDGAAKIRLDSLGISDWSIYRVNDTTPEIYAYPVPYSAYSSELLTFHYPIPKDAYVSVSVYDFAMNLVKKVITSEWRSGGPNVVASYDHWDGHNGKGDIVSAGIYYFKVELSTGEKYWGKLAIIP
jgi:hypothetical protein